MLHLAISIMLLASSLGAPGADAVPASTPVSCAYDQFSFRQEPLLATTADGRLFAAMAEGWRELFPPAGWQQVQATQDGSIYSYDPQTGDISRSADMGVSWQPHGRASVDYDVRTRLYPSPDPNVLLLVSSPRGVPNDKLWRSTDAGETWTSQSLEGGWIGKAVFSPAFAQDATAFVDLSDYHIALGIYKSSDGGQTWNASSEGLPQGVQATQPPLALSPSFPQDGVAFAGGGSIDEGEWGLFKSPDRGTTWVKVNDAHAGGPPALSPRYPADHTLIVSDWWATKLLLSRDDGRTLTASWERPQTTLVTWGMTSPHAFGSSPPTAGPYRMYLPLVERGAEAPELWLVAREATTGTCYLHRSLDLGASWQDVTLPD